MYLLLLSAMSQMPFSACLQREYKSELYGIDVNFDIC